MAKKLPATDVVIVGLGWTGAIMAHELTQAGLNVVALERGPLRETATDFPPSVAPDELRYAIRHDLCLPPAQETLTFRNTVDQAALPIRAWGSFLPASGVGGAGVHWNGQTWRFLPTDFRLRSHLTQRYGAGIIPRDSSIRDWPVSYAELEPYYEKFEYLAGISGRAGNLGGRKQEGGNPFEGARKKDYPLPPLEMTYAPTLFAQAAGELGLHPFPCPAANASRPYTNPLGVTMGPCSYCGFCERFGCGNYSKASPQTTILPVLAREKRFTARPLCEVIRVNISGGRATGVTYITASGEECEQGADLVLLCAYGLFNVRLLLLSGIGTPYDPRSGAGAIGRNYAYQTTSSVQMFFDDKTFNPFIGAGALGQIVDDWNGDNFDHARHGFIGGGTVGLFNTNGRPILYRPTPPGTPRWGAAWKRATADSYKGTATIGCQGSSYSQRGNYLDLDPTYTDRHGRKLLRMTFDFPENDLRMSDFLTSRAAQIARAMRPRQIVENRRRGPYSVVPYQTTHNVGGAIMGTDPRTSAVNRYLQSWDVSNVFVFGASAFPQNAGYNPTGTVGALAFWAAEAIRTRYLKSPGMLA